MDKILSAGEKIKTMRTALGLKQEDITGNELSKSLISMIEQDKRSVTPQTAEIIANCLNKYYGKSGQIITVEYLLETEKDVMRKEITKDLEHLRNAIDSYHIDKELIKNTFDKVMKLINQGKFEEEYVQLKLLRGDFHYNNYQYPEAIADYLDVLNHIIKTMDYDQIARMYIALGTIYQMQLMIDTAIVHYVKAVDTAIIHDTKNKEQVRVFSMFNQIICYRKMKRYDLVINQVGVFKGLKWEDTEFKIYLNRILLIEANTYRDLENWERAKGIYEKLMEQERKLDKETCFLLYENYGVFYRDRENKEEALKYFERALALKEDVDLNYLPALYLYQSTCYNLDEEYEKVISLLEHGLRLAKMVSKKNMAIELRFAFVEISIELEDYETALQQLKIVEEELRQNIVKPLLYDLYSFYAQVYMALGDSATSKEYTIKSRQKNYYRD